MLEFCVDSLLGVVGLEEDFAADFGVGLELTFGVDLCADFVADLVAVLLDFAEIGVETAFRLAALAGCCCLVGVL